MSKPVRSKRDFVKRYAEGEFGNASPTWDSPYDFDPDPTKLYHIRNRVAAGATTYNVPGNRLHTVYDEIEAAIGAADLYISEMCPTDKTTFQGEIRQSENHVDLTFTFTRKPMRDALAENTLHADGVYARELMRTYMDPSSLEWVDYLLKEYPDHTIEFSCFSVCWGTIPGRNTVIWEVRKY